MPTRSGGRHPWLSAFFVLSAGTALGHPKGFHKRDVLTLTAVAIDVVTTLDIDSGARCELLRTQVDLNADGWLSDVEVSVLRKKLAALATSPFKATIAGYPVALATEETKLSLRGDATTSPTGLSVAVLMHVRLPQPIIPGMTLVLEDESPDRSHVAVEVYQAVGEDAGVEAAFRSEIQSGEKIKVRLGKLASEPTPR